MDLCKNEKLDVLKNLICTEQLIVKCKFMLRTEDSCDDQERYLKMAMRIDSNDPIILHRKRKRISSINCPSQNKWFLKHFNPKKKLVAFRLFLHRHLLASFKPKQCL